MTRTHVEQLKNCLLKRCCVTCSDGRHFVGYFVCVDPYKNVVLTSAQEYSGDQSRYVGLIMIPGEHLRRFYVEPQALTPPNTNTDTMYL
jgi:small nuclear ribonucleoprotein (snRNP)-like protein